jgi:hypothetical protein
VLQIEVVGVHPLKIAFLSKNLQVADFWQIKRSPNTKKKGKMDSAKI